MKREQTESSAVKSGLGPTAVDQRASRALPLLLRFRAEKAKHLLLNRTLRVKEVGHYVGFRSLPRFNRIFKQVVGQWPHQYREQRLN